MRELATRSIVDQNCSRCLLIPEHDVCIAVAVHIGDGDRIHRVCFFRDRHRIGKFHAAQIEIDESSASRLVADDNVQASIAVEITQGDSPSLGVGRTEWMFLRDPPLAVVDVDIALAALAMRDN